MENNKDTISINTKPLNKIPKHNWAIVTYIFAILSVILILTLFTGPTFTGNAVANEAEIRVDLEEFINSQIIPGGGATIGNIEEVSGLYVAEMNIGPDTVPVYLTKDGKFITQGTPLRSLESLLAAGAQHRQEIEDAEQDLEPLALNETQENSTIEE